MHLKISKAETLGQKHQIRLISFNQLEWLLGILHRIVCLCPNSLEKVSWPVSYICLGWKKYKLESRLPGEISITSSMEMTHPYGRKWRGTKEPLDESERGEWKSWIKAQHSENEDQGIWSHHFIGNGWGNSGNSKRLYFILGLQNHCRRWLQPWNEKTLNSLEGKSWPT